MNNKAKKFLEKNRKFCEALGPFNIEINKNLLNKPITPTITLFDDKGSVESSGGIKPIFSQLDKEFAESESGVYKVDHEGNIAPFNDFIDFDDEKRVEELEKELYGKKKNDL